jgi:hypothetical protein
MNINPLSILTHTSPTLIESNHHYVHVRVVDDQGHWSNIAAHLGPFCIGPDIPIPKGLRTPANSKQIELKWYYMGEDLTYNIYKSDAENGFFIKCDPYEVTEPTFVDTDVGEGIQYWYKIKAVNASGEESLFSDAVSAKIKPVEGGYFKLKSLQPYQMQINGLQATFDIQAETEGGYSDNIFLNVVDLHPWMKASFNQTHMISPNYFARLTLYVNNVPPDKYTFYVSGVGNNRDDKIPLFLDVINPQGNASAISAYMNQSSVQMNESVAIYGQIFPMGFNAPLNVYRQHESDDQPVIINALTDKTKSYQIKFIPQKTGRYTIYSKWDGDQTFDPAQSPLLELSVLRGKSKLTCYTPDEEISADGMVLIKGELRLPRIENEQIVLKIQTPDGALKWVENRIHTDNNGRFEYSIKLDSTGIWKISSCWEGNDQYVGSVSPPLRLYPGLKAGKALIVAGGGLVNNNLWPATQYLTKAFYKILLKRKYSQEMIYYLSPDTNHQDDQIVINDNTPEVSDIKEHIQSLYQNEYQPDVNPERPFLLYLADHGGNETFKINHGDEILHAQDLDKWLDNLQTHTNCKVYIILEACYSGSFIDVLAASEDQKRVIITSAGKYESAYLNPKGDLSFSGFLFEELGKATHLYESFQNAVVRMKDFDVFIGENPQNPQIFDSQAGELAKTIYIGGNFILAGSLPEFGEDHTKTQTLTAGPHELYAHISDLEGIESAWAYIIPPNFHIPESTNEFETPIIDLPALNLIDQGNGYFSGIYDDFTQNGIYQVTFHCEDIDGNIAISEKVSINIIDGYTLGDLDNNGKINLTDAIISMQSIAGMTVSVSENARIFCNGVSGACEVIEILQVMAGMK